LRPALWLHGAALWTLNPQDFKDVTGLEMAVL
jgi:hypothetical protein